MIKRTSSVFRFLTILGMVMCFLAVAAMPLLWGIQSLTLGAFKFPGRAFLSFLVVAVGTTISCSLLAERKRSIRSLFGLVLLWACLLALVVYLWSKPAAMTFVRPY